MKTMSLKPFAVGLCIIVGIVVIAGIYFAGSPKQARLAKIDGLRSEQLSQISYAVDSYGTTHNWTVPESMNDLRAGASSGGYYYGEGKDPVTDKEYEYRRISEDRFEVCAIFDTDTTEKKDNGYYHGPITGEFNPWYHTTGRVCFERKINRPPIDAVSSEKMMAPTLVPVQ